MLSRPSWRRFFLLLLALSGFSAISVFSVAPISADDNAPHCDDLLSPVSIKALEDSIAERVTKVPEFLALRGKCQELGIRCWLFGGTAAGYAHYVKWNLLLEAGDLRYQNERFDYDYTNIYRSTQDADLVIDGTEEQAVQLEDWLREKYPYFQGSKSVWEVRLLRSHRGEKEPLIENPDFLNQHTDSNSTGMIEVTLPPKGESAVRDLRNWGAPAGQAPIFLQDVHAGKLHYYFSPKHGSTKRASEGLNPPILSAIRYLTKAFQYELRILPEDRARIQSIIAEFDPTLIRRGTYVHGWLVRNGKKLFQHAVNLEYAWDELEALGLREKLMRIDADSRDEAPLWMWMNREPLRTQTVGQGKGRTARELGIRVVAHETRDFLAYESITRSHLGSPNVFVSRPNTPGEGAVFGEGFYVAVGRYGGTGSGITIRFEVDPEAREGWDFALANPEEAVKDKSFVMIRNKAALRVIPESLDLGPVDYFKLLTDWKFAARERGMLEKFKRRMDRRMRELSREEQGAITRILTDVLNHGISARKDDAYAVFQSVIEYLGWASRLPNGDDDANSALKHLLLQKMAGRISYNEPQWKRLFVSQLLESGLLEDDWISPELENAIFDAFELDYDTPYLETMRAAVQFLADSREHCYLRLLDLGGRDEDSVEITAVLAIGGLKRRDPRSVDSLLLALENQDSWIRYSAARALKESAAAEERVLVALLKHVDEEADTARAEVFEALAMFNPRDPRVKKTLLRGMDDPFRLVPLAALRGLQSIARSDQKVKSRLLNAFTLNSDDELWREITRILGPDAGLEETLFDSCLKGDPALRTFCIRHFDSAAENRPEALAILRELMRQLVDESRFFAAYCLLKRDASDPEALRALLSFDGRAKRLEFMQVNGFELALGSGPMRGENSVKRRILAELVEHRHDPERLIPLMKKAQKEFGVAP